MTQPPHLFTVPAGTVARPCSKCRQTVYDIPQKKDPAKTHPIRCTSYCHYREKGVVMQLEECVPPSAPGDPTGPFDGRGFSHFIDCPEAKTFSKRPAREARA
jgi:hypothetical protein